jgi:hypothetical protein
MKQFKESIHYKLGLELEEKKEYHLAIEQYLLATLEKSDYLSKIYFHLAFSFVRINKYKEACESFLLINGRYFKADENSKINTLKNRKFLYESLQYRDNRRLNDYLELAQKAETLKCWSISSYAYRESLQRDECFNRKNYLSLANSLMQEQKYKEAFNCFLEQDNYNDSLDVYEAYRKALFLDDKIIFYLDNSDYILKCLDVITKDVYFDAYRHVVVVEDSKKSNKSIFRDDILIIEQRSSLYKRYLAQSKYIISDTTPPYYFKRRAEQVYLFIKKSSLIPKESSHSMKQGASITDMIQEVFFENKKKFHGVKERRSEYQELYSLAINEFNSKKWESSYLKFKELTTLSKDITKKLPTLYYLKESHIQNLVEKEKGSFEILVPYGSYQFSAENFAGIEALLIRAYNEDEINWKKVLDSFMPILKVMKNCDRKAIRSISDKSFLDKIELFSKQIIVKLDAKKLPYQVWFVFADLFIFARLYNKYQLAREKALESILALEEMVTLNQKRHKLNALSESFDEKEYLLLREQLLKEYGTEEIKKHLQLLGLSELFFNKQESAISFLKNFYNKDDKQFSDYIKNKTIAIVGPVDSRLNLGEEIDKHDVVIRFNYNGLDSSLHQGMGSKTTISFYITEVLIKNKFDKKKIEKMNELDWVVFDAEHTKDDVCFLGVDAKLRQRHLIAHIHLNPYFKGTANAIQRVLLDLLRFDTGKITIYNTNLFLESNYHKDYKSRGSLGAEHLILNWHDPLSNFIFLKRLKEFNIIDTDNLLSSILKMSKNEYIDALEERYGLK